MPVLRSARINEKMSVVPVRRSARIAAQMSTEKSRKFTIKAAEKAAEKAIIPEIEMLFTMLKDAEKNNIHNVSINEKVLHIIKIFKFILDPKLNSLIIQNPTFRLSIKNRIYNVTEGLKYMSIPYWIATEYTDVSRNLMEYILDIEKKLA
jgi:hypothetical protein